MNARMQTSILLCSVLSIVACSGAEDGISNDQSLDESAGVTPANAEAAPVYEDEVRENVTVRYWETTEDGPAAISVHHQIGADVTTELSAISLRRPSEIHLALHPDAEVPDELLDLEAKYEKAWGEPAEEFQPPAAPEAGRELLTHAAEWFETNICGQTGGMGDLITVECESQAGSVSSILVGDGWSSGPFGNPIHCPDPIEYYGYNDHSGSLRYRGQWSGGTLWDVTLGANELEHFTVTTNTNDVNNRLDSIDSNSVGRIAVNKIACTIIH